ncbi:MAG: hypothetical protein RL417_920, partial [Pseudomonadota bacterium]
MKGVLRFLQRWSEGSFFLILACVWGVGAALVAPQTTAPERLAFIIIASLSSCVLLSSLGYFGTLRLVPRLSDSVSVLAAIAVGAGIGRFALALLDGKWDGTPTTFVGAGLVTGGIVFVLHTAWCRRAVSKGLRRSIVLAVTDSERSDIIERYLPAELRNSVDFLSLDDLRVALESGGGAGIDLIVISRSAAREFDGEGVLLRAHLAGIPIIDQRRILADISGRIRVGETDLWTYLLEATPQTPLLRLFAAVKVGSEPILAVLLTILFAPIFVVLMVLIPLTSRGPIFYRQQRTGYLGRPFTLVKFRSMRADAEANGVRWASDNDDRTTKLGRFLRRTRLDELPQLWNVMRGEMSFCGPRPERPEIYALLKDEIPLFPLRTVVRPGITGWAQVFAGYAA